jgi:hypothetical protein
VQRRTRHFERDFGALTGDAYREPAVRALSHVVALFQPELLDVEVERFVFVEDVDGCDVELRNHDGVLLDE